MTCGYVILLSSLSPGKREMQSSLPEAIVSQRASENLHYLLHTQPLVFCFAINNKDETLTGEKTHIVNPLWASEKKNKPT